jgi:hypothetical protein
MDKNLENISEVSASWALSKAERLSLYARCIHILIEADNHAAAFEVLQNYVDKLDPRKLTEDETKLIRTYVLFGVKVEMVVQLKHIQDHFTVRKVSEKEPALTQLVSDVISKPVDQISSVYKVHKSLLESVKCSEADLKKKKQYFEITRLQKNRYSFQEI